MADLELSNVISISVSAAPAGVGAYNTSNLALFTRATPGNGFGSDGYKIYKSPSGVATDFGSSSDTAKMANAVFSQKPNILAGGGYLVVVPFLDGADVTEVQHIAFSTLPATGNYKLKYGANTTANIAAGANAAAVQSALRLLAGLGSITVAGSAAAGFDVTFTGVSGDALLLEAPQSGNSLQDSGPLDVAITITTTIPGTTLSTETIDAAITRTKDLVQYFGVLVAEITSSTPLLAAAAVIQTLNKIAFWPSRSEADVDNGGLLDQLRSGSLKQNRGLYYGSNNDTDCLVFSASYAGRALSTNFSGSNTTQTMHLKDLIGVQPDASMDQTTLQDCLDAGVDTYVSLQGVAKVFTSGKNGFFDDVYNQQWFVGALEVAGFNALAQSSSKLPQTEQGVSILKAAYRTVCEQAVRNQYSAPGTWNSSDTFGNQLDFLRNIDERGYYIYSDPVALQLQADREARKAPLIQIALKEAGAVHSSSVIVYINP